ncbi:NAD(P)/FAD-dependent oxidoreductase [Alicyclobacillus suci]|uniref:NAD(P)/FAD-dependent oxidoreductase n=2 Tax=Alicyclobacillus TaxID=29330 RepID=UPI001F31C3F9|nr:NAD(P)/FAD-dependent oxidoreductase [Alicyclobacillus suci]
MHDCGATAWMDQVYDVVIVGAGAAGIGVGIVLSQLGVTNFVVLEGETVGASFKKWPRETRFITPSFPGQGFGALDLNAIVPDTSPGYTLATEHMSGAEYAEYLHAVAEHFDIPISEHTYVRRVDKSGEVFLLETNQGLVESRFVVWATGEFHYPEETAFQGAEVCLHSSRVASWSALAGDDYLIIGGNESGMDAAYHLIQSGKRVTVVTSGKDHLNEDDEDVDPSLTLSPFTYQRMTTVLDSGRLSIRSNMRVARVEQTGDEFLIYFDNGETWLRQTQPICATGFRGGLSVIAEHFEWSAEETVTLSSRDESTKTAGLFVVGPSVRHGNVILCFIYKFRQRFAVIAEELVNRLGIPLETSVIEYYRRNNLYLDDLTCCEVKCEC